MNGTETMNRPQLSLEHHIPELGCALEMLPDSQLMHLAGAVSRIRTCGGRTAILQTEAHAIFELTTRATMFKLAMQQMDSISTRERAFIHNYSQQVDDLKYLGVQDIVQGLFNVTRAFAYREGVEEGWRAADAQRKWEEQQRALGDWWTPLAPAKCYGFDEVPRETSE